MNSDPFALPAFVLGLVSLSVAAIGAATGIAALVWQIVTRTRGAHRVKIRAYTGLMVYVPGKDPLGPFVQIEIINRGASAVQVRNSSISLPTGNALMVMVPSIFPPSPPLPHLLQPGTSVSFYTLFSDLQAEMDPRHAPKARAVAHLATGERVVGKKGELLAATE